MIEEKAVLTTVVRIAIMVVSPGLSHFLEIFLIAEVPGIDYRPSSGMGISQTSRYNVFREVCWFAKGRMLMGRSINDKCVNTRPVDKKRALTLASWDSLYLLIQSISKARSKKKEGLRHASKSQKVLKEYHWPVRASRVLHLETWDLYVVIFR